MTHTEETGRTAATTTIMIDVMYRDDRIECIRLDAPEREDVWESIRAFDALYETRLCDQIYDDYVDEDLVYLMLSGRSDDSPVMTVRDADDVAELERYLAELDSLSDEEAEA